MHFKKTDSSDRDFQKLVNLLDADLAIRDGDDHAFYDQFNKIANIKNVMVAYMEGEAVGCGAFKEWEDGLVEIKRMYVSPTKRNRGIAHQLLTHLETWAKELNYKGCVLETGINQPEAIRLYEKAGYHRIENYGQYKNVMTSICMKKDF
ncbi:MAG: GNAT family N-acetyltransferase [Chitinophagaceae bacterium]|nr:MAG: GNAT family N-acetyltransferase [Chitinophagaceae bacterium]